MLQSFNPACLKQGSQIEDDQPSHLERTKSIHVWRQFGCILRDPVQALDFALCRRDLRSMSFDDERYVDQEMTSVDLVESFVARDRVPLTTTTTKDFAHLRLRRGEEHLVTSQSRDTTVDQSSDRGLTTQPSSLPML